MLQGEVVWGDARFYIEQGVSKSDCKQGERGREILKELHKINRRAAWARQLALCSTTASQTHTRPSLQFVLNRFFVFLRSTL